MAEKFRVTMKLLDDEQKTRRQRGGRQPDVDFVPGDETVAVHRG